MAVNAASSSYVNNASSNKGFSGLASGVDTESMVEQLLSGTQSKIDKQEGLKQQLQWKQEIYRDIISQINSFQTKFFSFSSSSNLMSDAFFNAMSAISSSSAFKATATTSASTGSSSMEVRRLATKASITSGSTISGKLDGKLNSAALRKLIDGQLGTDKDYTVKFKVGDKNVSVNLRDVFVNDSTGTFIDYTDANHTTADRDRLIQEKLTDAFKDTGVKASVSGGTIKLVTEGDGRKTITVSGDSGKLGLQKLGLTANATSVNKTANKTSTLTGKVDGTPRMEFTVTLDDLKKTVSIDLRDLMNDDGSLKSDADIQTALQAGLDMAHGKDQVIIEPKPGADGFELVVKNGRKVDIGGGDAAMAVLGMKNGDSNRITLGSKLGDLNLGTKLQGGSFRFTINGQEFHFTEDTAIIDVMDVINRSDAGVRMIYRAQDDKFVLEAKESGAGKQIVMSQEEGNLINALFGSGIPSGKLMRSKALEPYEIPFSTDVAFDSSKLNATTPGDTTLKDLGLTLKDKDGKDIPEETKLSDLSKASGGIYSFDADNKTITRKVDGKLTLADIGLTLNDKDGNPIAGTTTLADLAKTSDGLYTFTGGKIMRQVDGNTTLGDLGLRFKGLDGSTKLSDLSTLTTEFDYEDGHIILKETFEPKGDRAKEAMLKLFGTDGKIEVGTDGGGDAFQKVDGQNAIVVVDGAQTERSSNNFTINGINYDLNDITGTYSDVTLNDADGKYYDADGNQVDSGDLVDVGGVMKKFSGTAAKVTVSQNTDQIMDGIKEFIDEYNKLVKTLNDLIDEDTTYREYPPLTSAQKKEMSEREIELWEEKSKGGLLYRDSNIETFLQQMRTALYQKPAGAGYALYELGIETGTWEQKGQLTFGTDGEAKLRQLLENDPTGVMKLFTDKTEGLGTKLNDILNQTAKVSSSSPGTLVQIAGVKGMGTDKNNTMYDQMKAIDDKIAALKRTYEAEKTRYWKQFNTMEQLISNMNTQSSYLAQMMGG